MSCFKYLNETLKRLKAVDKHKWKTTKQTENQYITK